MHRVKSLFIRFAQEAEIDTASLASTVPLRDVLARFWPAVRPYRGRLAIVLLLAMVGPLLDTLSISLYGRLVDDVLVPQELAMLGPVAAAYIGLTVLGGIVGFGRSYLSAWVTEYLLFDLRNRLFLHLQSLPEEIVAAAKMAGAHEFVERLPEGYGTRVGQRGRSLSGGQRQRLSIARALLRDAPVLVLDEPTMGLDNENAAQILATIRSLMAGRTTIIVSHDLNLVRQATRIVVLDRGRVVEEGAHEEPMAAGGLYARLALALESREADGGRRKSRSRGVEKRRRKVTSRDLRRAGVLA